MAGKMTSTGISLDQDEMDRIRVLMRGDRRSLSWLVREAVQMYLRTREADIARYSEMFKAHQTQQPAQGQAHVATSTDSKVQGPPNKQEKKGLTEGKE
jgi:predicted transcriptional regulator